MKRIWLVSYQLDKVTAGPSVRFQRYAPLFMARGYRMTIATRRFGPEYLEEESRTHFDIVRISSNYRIFHHNLFIFKSIWKAIWAKEKPEALLLFGFTTFQLWLVPLVKLRNIKLIYVNTMDFDTNYLSGNTIFHKVYNRIHFWLYRLAYNSLDYVVSSSSRLAENFTRFWLPGHKKQIIYNGVNIERFHPVEEDTQMSFRKKLQLPLEGKIILFVGLKVERKGILDLYEAWKIFHSRHPQHHLLLVGSEKPSASPQSYNDRWEAIKEEIQTQPRNIILRGNHPQIEEYFKAANVFIFLSKKEGMPNVLLEAMAAGLPMITTAFKGFSNDYGSPDKEFILVERNPDNIAQAIEQLTANPAFYQDMQSNALNRAQKLFPVEKSIERYIELFSS